MSELISLKELAQITNPLGWEKEYCAIRKRAQRGKYTTYQLIKGEGFVKTDDPSIPADIQVKIKMRAVIPGNSTADVVVISSNNTAIQEFQESAPNELSHKQLKFALAASKLVNLFIDHCGQDKYKGNKVQAQENFTSAYNSRAFQDIYEIIGKRDVQTLRRWRKQYLESGKDYRVLAPQYKTKRPSSVTPEQAELLITLLLKPSKMLTNEIIREAVNIFEAKRMPYTGGFSKIGRKSILQIMFFSVMVKKGLMISFFLI
jgi:hypothetical protein